MRDDELRSFVVDARADRAARVRRRRSWLARQLEEDRTLAAALRDAAGRGTPVELVSASGRTVRGVVLAAGDGLITVDGVAPTWVVPTACVALVDPAASPATPRATPTAVPTPVDLDALLDRLVERGARVSVGTRAGRFVGRVTLVGHDVVRLSAAVATSMIRTTDITDVVAV